MGAPPSDEQMAQILSDPTIMQTMDAALDNPQFIDFLIQSNPQLRNLPNARQIIQSPFMRQMMTNPDMLRNVMRMQRSMMGGQGTPFPAPGATDTTPADAAASNNNNNSANTGNNNNNTNDSQPPNPFAFPPPAGFPGGADMNTILAQLSSFNAMFGGQAPGATPGAAPGAGAQGAGAAGAGTTGASANTTSQSPPPVNPFAALFAPPPSNPQGQGQGESQGQGQGQTQPVNPFGQITPEMMQQAMSLWGLGAGASPAAPPDNRPPEERYAEQLRQLNDMGFYDFDRNVTALRRSGGSVQGAVEHLLGGS